ncbi:MAG: MASE3 domain-containing protein, partial [Gammaproteobacteria bacterium]|nr:MASE3 domain-containing protein [Gammaproteobacteria bacterium]
MPITTGFQLNIPPQSWIKTYWIIGLTTLAFAIVWLFPFHPVGVGLKGYAPLHTLLETFAIVISGAIFSISWHTRSTRGADMFALLAVGFLGVALLDVAHTLSFKGMPDWFTPSGGGKAINFWFLARYLAVFSIIVFVLGKEEHKYPQGANWLALLGVLLLVLSAGWVVNAHPDWLPVFLVPGEGLTPLKVQLEWLLIALEVVALALVWFKRKESNFYDSASLILALWLTCLSELCFTLYSNAADIFNLLGHVYKVL